MSAPQLTPAEVSRLEESLRNHANHLRKFLADADRDQHNLHLVIAAKLRVLLTDQTYVPILLLYADYKRVGLRIWGPLPPGFKPTPGRKSFLFTALVASSSPVDDAHEMSIVDYLDTPIGAVLVPDSQGSADQVTLWYTPRQLIKWVANTEGESHLQLKTKASLSAISEGLTVHGVASHPVLGVISNNDAFPVRLALLQIAHWTLHAIEQVLVAPNP